MNQNSNATNGAVRALQSAHAAGVEVCFANPGTTEMDLVSAFDAVPSIRSVLCLFEGVVTGAADGYGRIAEKPALTLTHLGPGFANGIANLHNARRAATPIVNLIGDHASWHVGADAPLTSDIDSLASPVSNFLRRTSSADQFSADMIEAIAAATGPPSGVATLIVPQDVAWETAAQSPGGRITAQKADLDTNAIEAAAAELRTGKEQAGLLIGGRISQRSLEAAAAIHATTGCRVWTDTFPARIAQGRGLPAFNVIPYFPEQAIEELSSLQSIAIIGSRAPVAFFGYRSVGRSDLLPEECTRSVLSGPGHTPEGQLVAMADALSATAPPGEPVPPLDPVADAALEVMNFGAVLAAHIPEGAIVVNEAATSGLGFGAIASQAPGHDMLHLTGGAIGQGLPNAVGAAIAAPDRRVFALQADGSGMYTLQSLWSMAREQLDITVVVCANRAYRILQFELGRTGNAEPGRNALAMTDLSNPELDWTGFARGMGVPSRRVTTTHELRDALAAADSGPFLIEALL